MLVGTYSAVFMSLNSQSGINNVVPADDNVDMDANITSISGVHCIGKPDLKKASKSGEWGW